MAVGDLVTILGEGFAPPLYGQVLLRFQGTYVDDKGEAHDVDFEDEAQVLGETKVTWNLWPRIAFDPAGERLGRFVGSVTATNQLKDGNNLVSDALPWATDIKPSLLPRILQPMGKGCESIVARTRENVQMTMSVEALGLREGTEESPLVFKWTFLAQHWRVRFDHGTVDPSSLLTNKAGSYVVEDRVTSGLSSTLQGGGNRNFFLKIKDDLMGVHKLTTLATEKLPDEANGDIPVSVSVVATDGAGKKAKIALLLRTGRGVEMIYEGIEQLAEREPAIHVTDCIPGGTLGKDVNYHETSTVSKHRSFNFNYNGGAGMRLGLPTNPWVLGLDLSAGFGISEGLTISSDKAESLNIVGHIWPGLYGVFYRQVSKVYRTAQIIGYGECGQPQNLGDVTLTDWVFTPELAIGDTCIPPSRLPPAETLVFED
jgi:hypothetical protein